MNKQRTIKSIIHAGLIDMGGMLVRQAFPSRKAEQIDPFLLLHHGNIEVPKEQPVSESGVGPHLTEVFLLSLIYLKGE